MNLQRWETFLQAFHPLKEVYFKVDGFFLKAFVPLASRLMMGMMVFGALVTLLIQVLAIQHRYPLDYGEAPLVDQAMRLSRGIPIYRNNLDTPPFTISNYPPLYILSLVPWVSLFGPNFWAGRLISTLCAWWTAWMIYRLVFRLSGDRAAALAGGLLFIANPFVSHWSALLRIDLLALAFCVSGLELLTRKPLSPRAFWGGALCLIAAIFTRQSYALAAPFAAFVWFLFEDKGKAFRLALVVGGISLALAGLLNIMTQGGFFFNIVTANVNDFGLDRLRWNFQHLWMVLKYLLVLAGFSLLQHPLHSSSWRLTAPFLVGAFLSSLTIGKIGSNVNYFLELCAALALCGGVMLAKLRQQPRLSWLQVVLLLVLTVQGSDMMRASFNEFGADLGGRMKRINELRRLEALVSAVDGPVLADEYMGMITLNGRYLYLQPFELTQLANAGIWDETPLAESIRNKEFDLILIHYFPFFDVYKERWTPVMLAMIERNYKEFETLADTKVYIPIR